MYFNPASCKLKSKKVNSIPPEISNKSFSNNKSLSILLGSLELESSALILEDKIDNNHEILYNNAIENMENNKLIEKKILNLTHKIDILKKDIEIYFSKKDTINKDILDGNKKLELIKQNDFSKKHINLVDLMVKHTTNKIDNKYQMYLNIINKIENINRKIEIDNSQLEIIIKQNEYNEKDLIILENDYNKYSKLLEKLDDGVLNNIKKLEKNISRFRNTLDDLNKEVTQLNRQLTEYECDIKKIEELKGNIKECKDKYENYTEINNIIETKNGLVNHIMNNIILIQLESKVNGILSLLTDFLIELKYDNKKIVVYKKEGEKKLKAVNLCGFERFVCNMAFRLVFNQINTKISCNFLIIDEGFSCCDSENLIRLKYLFDFIKQKYTWCLAITHLDTIKDYFDETIKIEKNNGKSQIIY